MFNSFVSQYLGFVLGSERNILAFADDQFSGKMSGGIFFGGFVRRSKIKVDLLGYIILKCFARLE